MASSRVGEAQEIAGNVSGRSASPVEAIIHTPNSSGRLLLTCQTSNARLTDRTYDWLLGMSNSTRCRGGLKDKYALFRQLREVGDLSPEAAQRRLQFPEVFVRKLKVEAVLRGHMGCVNRLAWNQTGSMLATGSDDRQVMLWRYPETYRPPLSVETQHQANIFGVAFLPCRGDRSLVSGAMDFSVQLHHLEGSPTTPSLNAQHGSRVAELGIHGGHSSSTQIQRVQANTTVYNCHKGRVKMVEVEADNPNMFWSASEDGTVRQFDTRCDNQRDYESPNVLLTVAQKSRLLDLMAVRINQARPHQMAVASSDPFVRVYDRRMLNVGKVPGTRFVAEEVAHPVLKLAPPHMCLVNAHRPSRTNTTYVSFGARGDKLVASYHADHAYSFDITSAAESSLAATFAPQSGDGVGGSVQPFFTAPGCMPNIRPTDLYIGSNQAGAGILSDRAEAAKNEGNRAFFDNNDNAAIWHYTEAIRHAPNSALLYASRAAAYLKRDWVSDAWAALQDCEAAIRLDPMFIKAHCRRVHALKALGQLQAAKQAADTFAAQFPGSVEDISRVWKCLADELNARQANAESEASHRAVRKTPGRRSLGRCQSEPRQQGPEVEEAHTENPNPQSMDKSSDEEESDSSSDEGEDLPAREGWIRNDEVESDVGVPSGGKEELRIGDPRIAGEVHRMLQRYIGHCNVQTDIKEACFMGSNDELVAAGSDDGRVFIYNSETGYPLRALKADEDVANCLQPHPSLPVLATSGIESVVRLWNPCGEPEPLQASTVMSLISHNQERLKNGTSIFRNVPPRVLAALTHNPDLLSMLLESARPSEGEGSPPDAPVQPEVTCRMG